jgi:hypothetical protein
VLTFDLLRLRSGLERESGAIHLDIAIFFHRAQRYSTHVIAIEVAFREHARGHLRKLCSCLASGRRVPRLELYQEIRRALLEPEVVVVAEGVAQQALIVINRGWTEAIGRVKGVTREIAVELGDRVTARGGIETVVFERHVVLQADAL